MKKFLVGLMSMFLLIGGGLLTACQTGSGTITLSTQSVEIEIGGGDEKPDFVQVTASVSGGKSKDVDVSWNGYENIVEASVARSTNGKNIITIRGLKENENAKVVVSASGCESKTIDVAVFSSVTAMSQKEESGLKKNFLVKGEEKTLNENSLLEFTPNKNSRRTITWSLKNDNNNVVLNGDKIRVNEGFIGSEVTLVATTEKNVSCEVTLSVLNKISLESQNIKVQAGYQGLEDVKNILETDGQGNLNTSSEFSIVSNNSNADNYELNALITYSGDLTVIPVVTSLDGKLDEERLKVVANGTSAEGYPKFLIYSDKDYQSLNGEFTLTFKINYQGYDYGVELTNYPIHIKVREVINEISITDQEGASVTETDTIENQKSIYTKYALGNYGELFRVELKPTSVAGASYTYKMRVELPTEEAFDNVDGDFSPLTIKYKDRNNILQENVLKKTANGVYETTSGLSADTIYLVSAKLKQERLEGVKITLTSEDEPSATTSFYASLVRAVSDFENALGVYDSTDDSVSYEEESFDFILNSDTIGVIVKKQFRLLGQSSTSGLHIKTDSRYVTIEDKLIYKSSGIIDETPYVIFEANVVLNNSAYGETQENETYTIYHDNGTTLSFNPKLDIFFPLTDASLLYETSSNSNSVVYTKYGKDDLLVENADSLSQSLNEIMLKNGTITPIKFSFNKTNNGKEASPRVRVRFVDLETEEDISLSELLEKLTNEEIVATDSSNHIVISADYIQTNRVGKTFAIFEFEGKGQDGKQFAIRRIVKIESFISADGFTFSQESDKNITLYASDTIADEEELQAKKTIRIYFANSNLTYLNLNENNGNIKFVVKEEDQDKFKIENVAVGPNREYVLFDIVALTTGGNAIYNGAIEVHYSLDKDNSTIVDIWTTINLTILNAQRVENVVWKNSKDDGTLYFNVGEREGQYLVFDVSPTNARNSKLKYLVVDENGNVKAGDSFVSLTNISDTQVGVSINTLTKTKGSMFVYPADMVYGGNIKYYDKNDLNADGIVSLNDLGKIKEKDKTWFDYLTEENVYFISYEKDSDGKTISKNVCFKDIIKKIDIVVADGSSFDYSYRIYSSEDLLSMQSNKYYTLVNSVEVKIEKEDQIEEFTGGLQGLSEDTTIKFKNESFNLFKKSNGVVRNLTLIGEVNGNGFVCDENGGQIENVVVDTNGTFSSVLKATGVAGGITGINNGEIRYSQVLGLTIEGGHDETLGGSIIGGIAGRNSGKISNAIVEIYRVQTSDGFETSQFKGIEGNDGTSAVVGALVGEAMGNSTIEMSYAYDYTLTSSSIANGITGAFVGKTNTSDGQAMPKVSYSFSVVGIKDLNAGVAFEDVYNSYYDSSETYESNILKTHSDSFVGGGQEGFYAYVNGGTEHLKGLFQAEKVTSIPNKTKTYADNNGYNKVVVTDDEKTLFMLYALKERAVTLTSSMQNDLDRLNTVSLANILEGDVSYRNIRVTSSDERVAKIIGQDIKVAEAGEFTLTLSSKQDAEIRQEIKVKVIPAFNGFNVSFGNLEDVGGYKVSIQKTKSGMFVVSSLKTQVYLGSMADRFDILSSSVEFESETSNDSNKNLVKFEKSSDTIFTASPDNNSILTNVTIKALLDNVVYENALFKKQFAINPEEGAISIDYSSEELSITPATNESVRVVVKTTYNADSLIPLVEGLISNVENDMKYTFSNFEGNVLEVYVTKQGEVEWDNGIYTYRYVVTFAIAENFRSQISEEGNVYNIYFKTQTNNESEKLQLRLNRQTFTSIDIANSIVENSYRNNIGSVKAPIYNDVYTIGERTSMLAPGNSSIMQISVNPEYAYYDYMEVEYSGVSVAGAVNIELLKIMTNNKTFVVDKDSNFTVVGNAYRLTPNENVSQIYLKLWINTNVEIDSTLCFKIKFCDSKGKVLTQANYYLNVNYLKEPRVTIDGENIAFLAKGSQAKIEIQVHSDQVVDNVTLEGTSVKGIAISSLDETTSSVDQAKGIRIFTATISASLSASAKNEVMNLRASVRRNINGFDETKDAVATIILVDFELDEDNILVGERQGNSQVLSVWAGVPKTVSIHYGLNPDSYPSGELNTDEAIKLLTKRDKFTDTGYYSSNTDPNKAKYLINYRDRSATEGEHNYQMIDIAERIFYVVNGQEYALNSEQLKNKPLTITEGVDKSGNKINNITFVGNSKAGTTVSMVLYTYVTANGVEKQIKTYFNVKIDAFSDPDLPMLINNSDEFLALNPDEGSERTSEDYILTNDIVLENYTPFDTTYISSLDGNGYTIYIKSFAYPEEGQVLNVALFNRVTNDTILKNIRVNLYEGGQLIVNTSQYKDINVAGFALANSGIITNCEVVAFYTDAVSANNNPYTNKLPSDKKPGINLFLTDGVNTTQEKFITLNSNFTVDYAGFVLENSGSITNSRVGGTEIYLITEEKTQNGQNIGQTYIEEVTLETFTMVGQGNMAGFVLKNTGSISATSVNRVDMENRSNDSSYYLAGFVGDNSGNIVTSFVEGESILGEDITPAKLGSSLRSLGTIAGFVYNNQKQIRDSYSNILISSSSSTQNVLYASGFAYINSGNITNGYSASQVENSMFTQMNFSGVDVNGNLLANGTYNNCYFYSTQFNFDENETDTSTESLYATGVSIVIDPTIVSSFYGFAITTSEADDSGIWRIIDGKLSLIEANKISYSHRYILYTDGSSYEGITREDENGSYILPYSTLVLGTTSINTALGGEHNPFIIASEKDFVEISGESQSTYVQKYYDDLNMFGTYRLVKDIDLSKLTVENASYMLPSTLKAFNGKLYGNGFTIQSIRLTSSDRNITSYGLFKSLEAVTKSSNEQGVKVYKPIVTNLTLQVENVIAGDAPMVGVLAGYISDATIVSVDIKFGTNAEIVGSNFVGALAGLSLGNTTIKNITVTNPSTYAQYYTSKHDPDGQKPQYLTDDSLSDLRRSLLNLTSSTTYDSVIIQNLKKYSYAGSLLGFADNHSGALSLFNYEEYSNKNYSINNVKINGIIKAKAMVVGGAIGLTGPQAHVNDISVVFDGDSKSNSSKLYSMFGFAGGVIGQSFGGVTRVYAQHTDAVQEQIEDNMYLYYTGNRTVERGILDLFTGDEDYPQKAIGGLIGYAGSGVLEVAYSKINVVSSKADYAGGVVGQISSTNSYTFSTKVLSGEHTNYLIHEVYATGDVRSNLKAESGRAGGIVGLVNGNKITLLSVNAYNYITTYDYEKKVYTEPIVGSVNNLSTNFKVNAFVGEVRTSTNEIFKSSEIEDYNKTYVVFSQGRRFYSTDGEQANGTLVATLSYYQSYTFASTDFYLNLIGDVKGETAYNDANNASYVYVISGPVNFTTSESTNTQEGFLKSAVWDESNWKHRSNKLFPEIILKNSSELIYLDCFNVEQVFNQMRNNNITVVVRGRTLPGAKTYADVNLAEYETAYGRTLDSIEGFYGTIIGNYQKVTQGENVGQYVKIVSYKNFLSSTKEGFTVKDLTVEYKTTADFLKIEANHKSAGLFVNDDIKSARIANLKIQLGSGIKFYNVNGEVGIVAPSIENTMIDGLKLEVSASLGQYMLTIENTSSDDIVSSVGLVSGKLIQNSALSIMRVSDVSVNSMFGETSHSIISVSGKASTVGGIFGYIAKEVGALSFRLNDIDINLHEDSSNNSITVTEVSGEDAFVAGAIGYIDNVDEFTTVDTDAKIDSQIIVENNSSCTNIFTGAAFGKISSVGKFEVGELNEINGYANLKVAGINVYAGGFAGQISNASETKLDFSNNKINYKIISSKENSFNSNVYLGGVVGLNETGKLVLSNVGEVSFDPNNLNISGSEACLGGLVGYAKSELNISATNEVVVSGGQNQSEIVLGNSKKGSFALRLGGLVGYAKSALNISLSGGAEIKQGYNISQSNSSSSTVDVGGVVGCTEGNVTIHGASVTENGKTSHNLIKNNSQYTVNVPEINFGGIIGRHYNTTNDYSFTSSETSFGGSLSIVGKSKNEKVKKSVYAGGVIGQTNIRNTTIKNSYNYGDVFVDYVTDNSGVLDSLEAYYFGGVVGLANNSVTPVAQNNYSLMTSHNSRYSTSLDRAHAMIGGGSFGAGSSKNYYNHKVCLLTDNNAVDVGYTKAYSGEYLGYDDSDNETVLAGSNGVIYKAVGIKDDVAPDDPTSYYITKLNPIVYNGSEMIGYDKKGSKNLVYYTLNSENSDSIEYRVNYSKRVKRPSYWDFDVTLSTKSFNESFGLKNPSVKIAKVSNIKSSYNWFTEDMETQLSNGGFATYTDAGTGTSYRIGILYYGSKMITPIDDRIELYETTNKIAEALAVIWINKTTLTNHAIIYESNQAVKVTSSDPSYSAPIGELTGFSFVSGLIVENDRVIKNATQNYGGIIGYSDVNTIIYACQAKGSIEVQSSDAVTIGGIVGSTRGKVFDSSVDMTMIYAGKSGTGSLGGIARTADGYALIENCYTGGKFTTYSATNCNALVGYTTSKVTIKNCYSYIHFDLHNYVDEKKSDTCLVWKANTEVTPINCYYDQDATEVELTNGTQAPSTSEDGTKIPSLHLASPEDLNALFKTTTTVWTSDYRFNYGYPTLKYGYLKNSSFAYVNSGETYYEIARSQEEYDSYVFDLVYTNRPNGYKINDKSYDWKERNDYYKIPNATVLNNLKADKNYILTNDINLDLTKSYTEQISTSSLSFSGIFDGQNYTIKGLNNSLFDTVGGTISKDKNASQNASSAVKLVMASSDTSFKMLNKGNYSSYVVMNLRLIDANIKYEENRFCYGVLANTLNGAYISKIVVSGEIDLTSDDAQACKATLNVGGIVGKITDNSSQIVCSTNLALIKIQGHKDSDIRVGGIVGNILGIKDSEDTILNLRYCSNYGPIYTTGKSMAGGIVGYIPDYSYVDIEIAFCYNTTSVLSGYAMPGRTSIETMNASFYAGGIVGGIGSLSRGKIQNCYNTGMIKAGNKTQEQISYAAGIVGHASSVKVTNCYNAGSVEALGKNPEWTFDTELTKIGGSLGEGVAGPVPPEIPSLKAYLTVTSSKNIECDPIINTTGQSAEKCVFASNAIINGNAIEKDASGNNATITLTTDDMGIFQEYSATSYYAENKSSATTKTATITVECQAQGRKKLYDTVEAKNEYYSSAFNVQNFDYLGFPATFYFTFWFKADATIETKNGTTENPKQENRKDLYKQIGCDRFSNGSTQLGTYNNFRKMFGLTDPKEIELTEDDLKNIESIKKDCKSQKATESYAIKNVGGTNVVFMYTDVKYNTPDITTSNTIVICNDIQINDNSLLYSNSNPMKKAAENKSDIGINIVYGNGYALSMGDSWARYWYKFYDSLMLYDQVKEEKESDPEYVPAETNKVQLYGNFKDLKIRINGTKIKNYACSYQDKIYFSNGGLNSLDNYGALVVSLQSSYSNTDSDQGSVIVSKAAKDTFSNQGVMKSADWYAVSGAPGASEVKFDDAAGTSISNAISGVYKEYKKLGVSYANFDTIKIVATGEGKSDKDPIGTDKSWKLNDKDKKYKNDLKFFEFGLNVDGSPNTDYKQIKVDDMIWHTEEGVWMFKETKTEFYEVFGSDVWEAIWSPYVQMISSNIILNKSGD